MDDTFKRILTLARRTGDRLIVTDPDGKDAFVLMGLDQYERLLGTPPVALPQTAPITPVPNPVVPPPVPAAVIPVEIPSDGRIPIPLKEDAEFGEEQFYLEPIE